MAATVTVRDESLKPRAAEISAALGAAGSKRKSILSESTGPCCGREPQLSVRPDRRSTLKRKLIPDLSRAGGKLTAVVDCGLVIYYGLRPSLCVRLRTLYCNPLEWSVP
jgi:hypothetical protein